MHISVCMYTYSLIYIIHPQPKILKDEEIIKNIY